MNTTTTYSYKEAMQEVRADLGSDPWGETMGWLFPIAEEIHFKRDFEVPADWYFRPSPFGYTIEEDDYRAGVLEGMNDADLLKFGQTLHRYELLLRRHDMNY